MPNIGDILNSIFPEARETRASLLEAFYGSSQNRKDGQGNASFEEVLAKASSQTDLFGQVFAQDGIPVQGVPVEGEAIIPAFAPPLDLFGILPSQSPVDLKLVRSGISTSTLSSGEDVLPRVQQVLTTLKGGLSELMRLIPKLAGSGVEEAAGTLRDITGILVEPKQVADFLGSLKALLKDLPTDQSPFLLPHSKQEQVLGQWVQQMAASQQIQFGSFVGANISDQENERTGTAVGSISDLALRFSFQETNVQIFQRDGAKVTQLFLHLESFQMSATFQEAPGASPVAIPESPLFKGLPLPGLNQLLQVEGLETRPGVAPVPSGQNASVPEIGPNPTFKDLVQLLVFSGVSRAALNTFMARQTRTQTPLVTGKPDVSTAVLPPAIFSQPVDTVTGTWAPKLSLVMPVTQGEVPSVAPTIVSPKEQVPLMVTPESIVSHDVAPLIVVPKIQPAPSIPLASLPETTVSSPEAPRTSVISYPYLLPTPQGVGSQDPVAEKGGDVFSAVEPPKNAVSSQQLPLSRYPVVSQEPIANSFIGPEPPPVTTSATLRSFEVQPEHFGNLVQGIMMQSQALSDQGAGQNEIVLPSTLGRVIADNLRTVATQPILDPIVPKAPSTQTINAPLSVPQQEVLVTTVSAPIQAPSIVPITATPIGDTVSRSPEVRVLEASSLSPVNISTQPSEQVPASLAAGEAMKLVQLPPASASQLSSWNSSPLNSSFAPGVEPIIPQAVVAVSSNENSLPLTVMVGGDEKKPLGLLPSGQGLVQGALAATGLLGGAEQNPSIQNRDAGSSNPGIDPRNILGRISDQVSTRASELRALSHLSFQLIPESLGPVTVQLILVDHAVSARIIVARPEVREAIQNNLIDLKTSMNQAGLQIDQLQVQVQGGGAQQLAQYFQYQQEGSGYRLPPGGANQALEEAKNLENNGVLSVLSSRLTLVDVLA